MLRERQLRQHLAAQRGRLYRIAYTWCHNRSLADDLVQETLEKALGNLQQLREPGKLRAWLGNILANCWRDYLRRHREVDDIDNYILETVETPERIHEREDLAHSVRTAVASLPQGQRMVLALVDLEECSYAEVAAILRIPVGTVMSRLCRARRSLAERLLDDTATESSGNVRKLR